MVSPTPRNSESTAVVWSPRPPRMPTCPPTSPRSVVTDIQDRINVGTARVVVQPNPTPVPSDSGV